MSGPDDKCAALIFIDNRFVNLYFYMIFFSLHFIKRLVSFLSRIIFVPFTRQVVGGVCISMNRGEFNCGRNFFPFFFFYMYVCSCVSGCLSVSTRVKPDNLPTYFVPIINLRQQNIENDSEHDNGNKMVMIIT